MIRAIPRILIGALLLWGAFLICWTAVAAAGITYSFGPHVGPTRPGPHSRWGYKGSNGPTIPGMPKAPQLSDRCKFYRGEYRLRHGINKPNALRPFRGCRLWTLDHDYHSRIDGLREIAATADSPILAVVASVELAIIPHE